MKALIIGGTGATGKDLVSLLLQDDTISEVHSFVRKTPSLVHPKLRSHVVDFEQPDTWTELLHGDVAFSCLGTTLAQAGSKEAQWRVDYDYQWQFAERCRQNGVPAFVLISAAQADAKSSMFYNKMKELNFKFLNVVFDLYQQGQHQYHKLIYLLPLKQGKLKVLYLQEYL